MPKWRTLVIYEVTADDEDQALKRASEVARCKHHTAGWLTSLGVVEEVGPA